MYIISVHGAPVKPMRGTWPARVFRVRVSASNTYPSSFSTSTSRGSFSMSAGVFKGSVKCGPGFIITSIPMACGTTRMSEKMIAASRRPAYRLIGCMVISVARVGERHISKNSCVSRVFRNSGTGYDGLDEMMSGWRTWEISPCLAHDPYGCTLCLLAASCSKEQVVC